MALNDPLDQIDTTNIDQTDPVIPWVDGNFDGFVGRNQHEQALAARDRRLLTLVKALKQQSTSNTSPLYPFKDDATLHPSSATPLDGAGATISAFVINAGALTISKDFIKDLRLVLSSDFREPYLSGLVLRRAVDPDTNLVRIFVDLEISARYSQDQMDHVVFSLTGKAYNDVQDNSVPSSKDNVAFDLVAVKVAGRDFLNSGTIEFSFIGSIQSQLATSWSVGTYQATQVEGFASVPGLVSIVYTFSRQASKITQLAYDQLGDLQNAIPFLSKVKDFPFDSGATASAVLAKYITDVDITAPTGTKVFIKRIRKTSTSFIFVFSYNDRDTAGNLLGAVNIGVATVLLSGSNSVSIKSLGSNKINGVDPDWLDEIAGQTVDNYGSGTLTVLSPAALQALFNELLQVTVAVGSPSPIQVSPAQASPVIGLFVDPNQIDMVESNSYLDSLAKDGQGLRNAFTERPLGPAHITRNVQVSINGYIVNRRISYGNESLMRDFYGLTQTEILSDNIKINLDDEWFDTTANILKRYQLQNGHRAWRTV